MLNNYSTDIELWLAVRMDDQSAFNILFDKYWVKLYKTAFYNNGNEEESAEIVNDIFVSIWNRRKELEIVSFPAFMQTSVRFQICKRRKTAKLKLVYVGDLPSENQSQFNEGESKVSEQELTAEIHEYLYQLPKRCQEIFKLSRIDCLSNQQIADRLNISKRSVENQLSVAVKHLKSCLKHAMALVSLFFLIQK
jgi:RNA polymerase sigma-70 factor (family 1)